MFPAISTGVYGYPIDAVTRIAVETVSQYLSRCDYDVEVTFCCFLDRDLAVYQNILDGNSSHA